MEGTPKQPPIQSITRAIAILRCFSKQRELGLTEISRMVGLHKSTTAGIVNTLKAERFLEQNPQTGKLRLGTDLFFIAVNARLELEDVCEPHLRTLLEETGETVNLAIRDGSEVVYIAKKESPHSMRISTMVGKRMPMYCTAIGKVILAHMPEQARSHIIDGTVFTPFTDKTIPNVDSLISALDTIRRDGVAYDFEELEYGLICVAAPIFYKTGEPAGAISVSGPSMRMDEETRTKIARHAAVVAARISEDLSHLVIAH